MGLFPAVTAFIQPSAFDCHSEYHLKWFVPIWVFTLFNLTDTIGKMSSSYINYPKIGEVSAISLLARVKMSL